MTEVPVSRSRILMAFAAVYLVWGSTYLGIRFAVETIPPFLMAGVRFGSAGAVLYLWLRARGAPRPSLAEWRTTAIAGALMIAGGNGLLSWSEQFIPSGLAALLVATVPLWFVAFMWFGPDREKPNRLESAGLLLGLAGVAALIGSSGEGIGLDGATGRQVAWGTAAVIVATISWAAGSMYNRHAVLPRPTLLATAMTMLGGGAVQLAIGTAIGEPADLDIAAISARSVAALVYLSIFGSIVAFSAYAWLLRAVRPSLVGTYAYVNPVVAVLLGWWLVDEQLTGTMLIGTVAVIGSVILVQRGRARAQRALVVGEGDRSRAPSSGAPAPVVSQKA